MTGYLRELQQVIHRLHGVQSTHIESVPVKETFQGRTVWEGVVEAFQLHDHPKVPMVYAWAHDTDEPDRPRRHVTVLHIHPITSAREAIRAAVVQEFRSLESEQEN